MGANFDKFQQCHLPITDQPSYLISHFNQRNLKNDHVNYVKIDCVSYVSSHVKCNVVLISKCYVYDPNSSQIGHNQLQLDQASSKLPAQFGLGDWHSQFDGVQHAMMYMMPSSLIDTCGRIVIICLTAMLFLNKQNDLRCHHSYHLGFNFPKYSTEADASDTLPFTLLLQIFDFSLQVGRYNCVIMMAKCALMCLISTYIVL